MLSLSFMQRAFLGGLIVAVICPAIGLFLVLRRQAQVGDALAHVSLAGVAAALLTGAAPMAGGLLFAVGASLGMDSLRQSYKRYSELSVAILLSASMAIAAIMITIKGGAGANVMAFLFGSIYLVDEENLRLMAALGALVLLVVALLYKELLSVTFDEELARIGGLPVRWVNVAFTVLSGVTVSMSMHVVGMMLVSSLIVVPTATALQLARSFRSALGISVLVGLVSVLSGLVLAYWFNTGPGGTIVLTAIAILLLVLGYKRFRGLE